MVKTSGDESLCQCVLPGWVVRWLIDVTAECVCANQRTEGRFVDLYKEPRSGAGGQGWINTSLTEFLPL